MSKCLHCGTKYIEGNTVDIGIGFVQVSPDEPDCACEYIEYMRKEEQRKQKGDK